MLLYEVMIRKGGMRVSSELYELLALGARYWFAFLGVIIVWRSYSWLRKDEKQRKKRLRQLPDAGMVGEMVVLSGSKDIEVGTVIPIPREGSIGSSRKCDIYLPCKGVAPHHGDFEFKNGIGLVFTPSYRQVFIVDHEENALRQKEWFMHHGSRLTIGEAVVRMRLFVGLETSRPAVMMDDIEEPLTAQTAAMAYGDWQDEDIEHRDIPLVPPVPIYSIAPYDWENATHPYKRTPRQWQETGGYSQSFGPPQYPQSPSPQSSQYSQHSQHSQYSESPQYPQYRQSPNAPQMPGPGPYGEAGWQKQDTQEYNLYNMPPNGNVYDGLYDNKNYYERSSRLERRKVFKRAKKSRDIDENNLDNLDDTNMNQAYYGRGYDAEVNNEQPKKRPVFRKRGR